MKPGQHIFLTTVLAETGEQLMYTFTDTRESGILEALTHIASIGSDQQDLKDSLTIKQVPNSPLNTYLAHLHNPDYQKYNV